MIFYCARKVKDKNAHTITFFHGDHPPKIAVANMIATAMRSRIGAAIKIHRISHNSFIKSPA